MRPLAWILVVLVTAPVLWGAPARVLVIGDSMSAEYAHELPFSAPDSNPGNPNTENWVEILDVERAADLDFGSNSAYPDLRLLGFEYNWGVPGATAEFWEDVLGSSLFEHPEYLTSKLTLLGQLSRVDVVVLFIGGNDVSSDYGPLYNNTPSPGLKTDFLARITFIIDTLRDERGDLPIVLVNVPDVGVTPDIQEDHPDPAKRADATAHIADLNAQLAVLATAKNAHLVDLFAQNLEFRASDPFFIGTAEMIKSYHPENPPNYAFCKLGFHPASGLQAVIGNLIVEGINSALGRNIAPLPPREIVRDVLGLDPDQPFLDWIALFPGASTDLLADDERDGLPNIGEFALRNNPLGADPPGPPFMTQGVMTFLYHPDPEAARLVATIPEESSDLQTWSPIPAGRLDTLPNGQVEARLAPGPGSYIRLRFTLAP